MRNFNTVVGTAGIPLDEDGTPLRDEYGRIIFDENAVLESVYEQEELATGVFIALNFSTPLYYSSFDIDLYWNGHNFIPGAFNVESINFASDLSTDKSTLALENVTSTMPGIMLNNDELGSDVTIHLGSIKTSDFSIYDVVEIFNGEITGWTLSDVDEKCTFELSGLMARWSKKTLRIAQGSCPWPFGGEECKYTGSLTNDCRQQYSYCKALSNQNNFGGFKFLPDLQEAKIYWGQNNP